MRNFCLLAVSLVFSVALSAAEHSHSLGVSVNASSIQDNQLGLALNYQGKFSSEFGFEAQLLSTGQLRKFDNNNEYHGDLSLISIGGVLLKQYHERINLSVSAGFSYTASSNNRQLVQQGSISPYLKLGFDYQLTPRFTMNIGHQSFFQDQQLGNHHSVFLGISYRFGKSSISSKALPSRKDENTLLENQRKSGEQKKETTIIRQDIAHKNITDKHWRIQLGAFTQKLNATQFLTDVLTQYPKLNLSVNFIDGYFRILSPSFSSKEEAKLFRESSLPLSISSLVKQF